MTDDELKRYLEAIDAILAAKRLEIERLRGWLEFLGGELAKAALRGDPVPQPRSPRRAR